MAHHHLVSESEAVAILEALAFHCGPEWYQIFIPNWYNYSIKVLYQVLVSDFHTMLFVCHCFVCVQLSDRCQRSAHFHYPS
jgi:hypothetical protein